MLQAPFVPPRVSNYSRRFCYCLSIFVGTILTPPPLLTSTLAGCELLLDVKGSLGKLSVPEETKVAHGDDNLSLEDFLSAACTRAGGGAGPMH